MKTYELVLAKSYVVRIKAVNKDCAKECAEFFTGDIHDISSVKEREEHNFLIEDIDCKINQVFEVQEVNDD